MKAPKETVKETVGFCVVIGFAVAAIAAVVVAILLTGGTAGAQPLPVTSTPANPLITGGDTCADALPKVRFASLDSDVYTLRKDGVAVKISKDRVNGNVVIVGDPLLPGESATFALTVAAADDSTTTVTTLEERVITRPSSGYCAMTGQSMPDYYPQNHRYLPVK